MVKKNKIVIIALVLFFVGIVPVWAAPQGVSYAIQYVETDGGVSRSNFVNTTNSSDVDETEANEEKDNESNQEVQKSNTSYCAGDPELLKAFKFLGRILSIVKILIPIVIIVLGAVDFFKAMIGSKDDEIKKSARSLIMRVIAGVVIFFIPTVINLVFRLIDDWNQYYTDYSVCVTCVTNPSKCQV